MKNETLYQLVHSLNATEKKLVTLYLLRQTPDGKSNNSTQLFKAIQQGKDGYNEKAFMAKHKRQPFAQNLAYEKHRLMQAISQALRHRLFENNSFPQFHDQILNFYFYAQKGLADAAENALDAAAFHAEKVESAEFKLLLQIYRTALDNNISDLKGYEQTYTQLLQQIQYERKSELISYAHTQLALTQKGLRSTQYRHLIHQAEKMLKQEVPMKVRKTLSFILIEHYTSQNKAEKAFATAHHLFHTIKKHPNQSYYLGMWQRGIVYNLMEAAFMVGKAEEVNKALQYMKMFNEKVRDKFTAADDFALITCGEIMLHWLQPHIADVKDYARQKLKQAEELKTVLFEEYYFMLLEHLAYLLFSAAQFEECLKLLQKMQLQSGRDYANRRQMALIKLLEIFCHTADSNVSVIPSLSRGWKRYMEKHETTSRFAIQAMPALSAAAKQGSLTQPKVLSMLTKPLQLNELASRKIRISIAQGLSAATA